MSEEAGVAESVGEGLETMAVRRDGEVALDEGMELRHKVHGARHLIVKEEVVAATD